MESENQTVVSAPPAISGDQAAPAVAAIEPAPAAKPDRSPAISNKDRIVIFLCAFAGAAAYAVARALFALSGFSLPLPGGLVGAFLVGGNVGALIAKGKEGLRWIYVGPKGLRAGWSVLIAFAAFFLLANIFGAAFSFAHLIVKGARSPLRSMFFGELDVVLSMLGAVFVVGLIERRRILDYNLTGPRRLQHFLAGLVTGFLALSALIAALAAGGWLHFGPVALSGAAILRYGAFWGCFFLLVGCFEEGSFRCYLQSTLTRGLQFWWALTLVAVACVDLAIRTRGNGVWGVYIIAILGLFPCFILHEKAAPTSGFWQAAWVTSTFFGFVHTSNNGENWIGIFQAATIGFIFCVSIRVTGSAWWAIGCHAAWDWAETFFYGANDSGLPAQGHFLTVNPAGQKLLSGGVDGPEGSLICTPILLLLLVALLLIYGRRRPVASAAAPVEQRAG